jgi:hypothetical protein
MRNRLLSVYVCKVLYAHIKSMALVLCSACICISSNLFAQDTPTHPTPDISSTLSTQEHLDKRGIKLFNLKLQQLTDEVKKKKRELKVDRIITGTFKSNLRLEKGYLANLYPKSIYTGFKDDQFTIYKDAAKTIPLPHVGYKFFSSKLEAGEISYLEEQEDKKGWIRFPAEAHSYFIIKNLTSLNKVDIEFDVSFNGVKNAELLVYYGNYGFSFGINGDSEINARKIYYLDYKIHGSSLQISNSTASKTVKITMQDLHSQLKNANRDDVSIDARPKIIPSLGSSYLFTNNTFANSRGLIDLKFVANNTATATQVIHISNISLVEAP